MEDPDSFGSDVDDGDWLLAATQVEASQARPTHDLSPRPTKRRKESHGTADDAAEIDEHYYFPGELDKSELVKRSKHKIHDPGVVNQYSDLVVTQTQHDLDEDPAAIRGAIWKRPQPLSVLQQAQSNVLRRNVSQPAKAGIANYFQAGPLASRSRPETDAALAARLRVRENENIRTSLVAQPVRNRPPVPRFDVSEDLADLPSDAFSSSPAEKPARATVSTMAAASTLRAPIARAPLHGLKQMTLDGQAATQELTASQAAKKRHAWPLKSKDEAPTHHKLNFDEMATWVYPTNLGTVRDYQFNIVSRSLFHNTLVALPTGLGKTFIAATVMLNYYRWTSDAQIVFMAPTKPLIAQQMEACYGIVGIPRRDTVLMTGETAPGLRADEWLERRVFFMTPQTVINDLKTGICDPKKIVLIVVDEAHKATGAFAYTEVVSFLRRFNPSFRVLALTATPGSSVETVQAVIDNLGIARVELRTEQSLDIRPYTHEKQTEVEVFEYSDEQTFIMDLFSAALRDTVNKLKSHNAYFQGDPMALTAFGLTQARKKWMATDAGRKAPKPIQGMINAAFQQLSKIAHGIGLLKNHGIKPFYSNVLEYQKSVESGQEKGKTASAIVNSDNFVKMMSSVRAWTASPDFIGHPKLEYLRQVVLNHFLDAAEGRHGSDGAGGATRIMIFASYRDSTEEICRVLKRNEPMVRPHVFVGQAASKSSEGMDQKRQNAVIQDFKNGKFNTLIATSIGEEGLDIGTVDLIICYDSSSSPIRMLQRVGRTGRKRIGRVVLLLMKGKEENDYAKSQDNYLYIQKTIADSSRYTYHDEQSPRILPKESQPVVDKRPVEIPVENSQPIDLNEKARKPRGKGKTKRPPKKFHMPDGVRTTFVRASKLGSDADSDASLDEGKPMLSKPAVKQPVAPDPAETRRTVAKATDTPPEHVQLPFLDDVLLSTAQQRDLRQRYVQTADINDGEMITGPDMSRCAERLRALGPTKYIPHRRAAVVQKTMQSVHSFVDERQVEGDLAQLQGYIRDHGPAAVRLFQGAHDERGPVQSSVSRNLPQPRPSSGSRAIVGSASRRDGLSDEKMIAEDARPIRPVQTDKAARRRQPAPATARRPSRRPAQATSHGSSAPEASESSPEPTPEDMRIGTQGIDLGSRDTSGEDEEEEPDSELEDFIAGSSDPIEMASSSQNGLPSSGQPRRRGRPAKLRRRVQLSDLDELDESDRGGSDMDAGHSSSAEVIAAKASKRKRVIDDSDSDG